MGQDSPISLIIGVLGLVLSAITTLGPYVHGKPEKWRIQKILNLIFGLALIGTNLLMVYYSAPAEVQIYSAAGAVWLPFTIPPALHNVPPSYVPSVGILVDIFAGFLILAGIGIAIGITRLNRFCNIQPTQPSRTLGGGIY